MQENPLYFLCDTSLVRLSSLGGKEDLGFKKINHGDGTRSPQIILGTIVTGDVFVSSEATTRLLRKEMNADAVEMEGAAIAQVCWQQHKPLSLSGVGTITQAILLLQTFAIFMKQPLTIRQDW